MYCMHFFYYTLISTSKKLLVEQHSFNLSGKPYLKTTIQCVNINVAQNFLRGVRLKLSVFEHSFCPRDRKIFRLFWRTNKFQKSFTHSKIRLKHNAMVYFAIVRFSSNDSIINKIVLAGYTQIQLNINCITFSEQHTNS